MCRRYHCSFAHRLSDLNIGALRHGDRYAAGLFCRYIGRAISLPCKEEIMRYFDYEERVGIDPLHGLTAIFGHVVACLRSIVQTSATLGYELTITIWSGMRPGTILVSVGSLTRAITSSLIGSLRPLRRGGSISYATRRT